MASDTGPGGYIGGGMTGDPNTNSAPPNDPDTGGGGGGPSSYSDMIERYKCLKPLVLEWMDAHLGSLPNIEDIEDLQDELFQMTAQMAQLEALRDDLLDIQNDIATGQLNSASLPVGTPIPWIKGEVPNDTWIVMDGSAFDTGQYPELYAFLGTNRVPDWRGRFVRMADLGKGLDPGRTVGSFQNDQFKSHTHEMPIDSSSGSAHPAIQSNPSGSTPNYYGDTYIHKTGGSETRPTNVAILWLMKAKSSDSDVENILEDYVTRAYFEAQMANARTEWETFSNNAVQAAISALTTSFNNQLDALTQQHDADIAALSNRIAALEAMGSSKAVNLIARVTHTDMPSSGSYMLTLHNVKIGVPIILTLETVTQQNKDYYVRFNSISGTQDALMHESYGRRVYMCMNNDNEFASSSSTTIVPTESTVVLQIAHISADAALRVYQ